MLHARGVSHSNLVHTNRVLRVDIERGGKHVYRVTGTLDRGFGIATIGPDESDRRQEDALVWRDGESLRESTILEFNGKYVRGSKNSQYEARNRTTKTGCDKAERKDIPDRFHISQLMRNVRKPASLDNSSFIRAFVNGPSF